MNLATLEDFFDHEEDTIRDFIAIVLHDWQTIRADLIRALEDRNLKDYRFHTHRMKSMVNLLEATRLQYCILQLRTHLMENPTADFTHKQRNLLRAMDEVVVALQQRIV